VRVSGNQFVNQDGTAIQLRGANMSGLEFGVDPFSGVAMSTVIAGLQSWDINVVRLPLNEGYWLGTCTFSSGDYQTVLSSAVASLTQAGIYVILDLHETSATAACPSAQDYMANTVHSVTFWQQVAAQYASNPAVMFELFNEPHTSDNPIPETQAEWNELLNGGINGNSQYAGMQPLLNAVRGAGASNVVLVDGLNWAADLGHVNSSDANGMVIPTDTVSPAQIAGVMHYYYDGNYNASGNYYLSHGLPLILTEYGDNSGTTGGDTNTTSMYAWGDPGGTASQVAGVGGSSYAGISYVAWAWVWSSGWGGIANYQLVNSASGTVYPGSTYATEVHSHYLCRVQTPTATCN
jgi:endoglucanase